MLSSETRKHSAWQATAAPEGLWQVPSPLLSLPKPARPCNVLPLAHTPKAAKLCFAERFLSQAWQAASCSVGSELRILRNKPPTASRSPRTCRGWRRLRNPGFVAACQPRCRAARAGYPPGSAHQQTAIRHCLNKLKRTEFGIGSKIKSSLCLGFTRFIFCCLHWLSIISPLFFQSFTDCTPFLALSC